MLKEIDGMENVDIDLNSGLVTVEVRESVELTEAQMRKLLHDAGFTYRNMTKQPQ